MKHDAMVGIESMDVSEKNDNRLTLSIDCVSGISYRAVRAVAHSVVADLELMTPSNEGWVISVAYLGDQSAAVRIELLVGGSEADRAEAMLNRYIASV